MDEKFDRIITALEFMNLADPNMTTKKWWLFAYHEALSGISSPDDTTTRTMEAAMNKIKKNGWEEEFKTYHI